MKIENFNSSFKSNIIDIIEFSKSVKVITALTTLIVLSVVVYAARHILSVGGTLGEVAFKLSGLFLILNYSNSAGCICLCAKGVSD